MLSFSQVFILGLLQGLTELFPVSSLGHTVLIPALLHWSVDENAPAFVEFVVATHFATAVVLFIYFWSDWVKVVKGFTRLVLTRKTGPQDVYARLSWLIIIATIPAGLIGLLFQKHIEHLFTSPKLVAVVLILNGILLYGVEFIKRTRVRRENTRMAGDTAIVKMSWIQAAGTGVMQSLALIPGFSRTGSSLAGGLLSGLDHESAARFSFLLATPIIFAAALLKLPALLHANYPVMPIILGAIIAGAAAYLSVAFLVRYFKSSTLMPFAWYCIIAGALAFVTLTYF